MFNFGGGDVNEENRNKEENSEIHEKNRWAKKDSIIEKVVIW